MGKRHGTVVRMIDVVYTVLEDTEVSTSDRDGTEVRYFFPEGTAHPDTEDEWFVLEHILVPQGSAERVKKEL